MGALTMKELLNIVLKPVKSFRTNDCISFSPVVTMQYANDLLATQKQAINNLKTAD